MNDNRWGVGVQMESSCLSSKKPTSPTLHVTHVRWTRGVNFHRLCLIYSLGPSRKGGGLFSLVRIMFFCIWLWIWISIFLLDPWSLLNIQPSNVQWTSRTSSYLFWGINLTSYWFFGPILLLTKRATTPSPMAGLVFFFSSLIVNLDFFFPTG